mgnify:CR=1
MVMEQNKPIQSKRPCAKKPLGAFIGAAVMLSAAYFNPPSVSQVVCDLSTESATTYQMQPSAATNPASQCSALLAPEISWLEWAVGKSSSYQLHFFDLLELLYGNSESNFSSSKGQ